MTKFFLGTLSGEGGGMIMTSRPTDNPDVDEPTLSEVIAEMRRIAIEQDIKWPTYEELMRIRYGDEWEESDGST